MTTVAKTSNSLNGASVGIPPRHIDFNFPQSIPKYFYAGNATATTFFAMLSGFFPPGERYFMDSVRHFRDRVTDKEQRAAISGFMGQEAIHGREHERLAEQLLEDKDFQGLADPEMIKIWQWHALEELEHKSVAYDVYELVGNRYSERVAATAASLVVLLPMLGVTWAWMLARDGKLGSIKDNAKGLNMLFGRKGFVSKILPRLPEFTQRHFHPGNHDTRHLEQAWRERLFAEGGELFDVYKNRVA